MRRCIPVGMFVVVVGVAELAYAVPITLTLEGDSFSALADTVTVDPVVLAVDLTPNVPVTIAVQPGGFTVGDSGFVTITFPFLFSQNADVNGVAGVVSQSGNISMTPSVDTLTILDGSTVTFALGSDRFVYFTPHGTVLSRAAFGTSPFVLEGTLLYVPEPSTFALLAIAVGGFVSLRKRRTIC
jgi:hypothetical protein